VEPRRTAPVTPHDSARLRLSIVGVVVVSLFAALFARLWYLQVLDSEQFVQAATRNQVRLVYQEAPRGRILDRQGRVLANNRRSEVITVSREDAREHPDMLPKLAALLGIELAELEKRIADVRFSPYKPVPVAQDVSEEIVVYLREHAAEFPGVEPTRLARRVYHFGALAAHVLGYVGEINDKELADREGADYRLGDSIGKSGVELVYERDLRGIPGIVKHEVNSQGKVLRDLGVREPIPGDDVQLTIDIDVQRLVEESLDQGLQAARQNVDREEKKHFLAPAGAAVVLDPTDGSVLAIASHPSYDPNNFVNGISRDTFAALQDPNNHYPLNNRAVMGQYAPGSTFKLMTAIAGLQGDMIAPNSSLTDEGIYRVPNCRGEKCTYRNAGGRSYGRVNLQRAIVVSSDVYFYWMGARFWVERSRYGEGIQGTARRFGFGSKTGIPLPTEKAGRVPDPDLKRELHERYPEAFPEGEWRTGDSINLAIGQGEMVVTPIQLANAYATFANGGAIYEPRVAARVLDRDGDELRTVAPSRVGDVDLPPGVRDPILQGLRGVVAQPEGTAAAAFAGFPADFPVAGKTGTAQVARKQDTAVFVAFAPFDNPRYTVAVFMEEAGFGGSTAAPVARRILEGIAGQPPGPIQIVQEAVE
jgi:penicillin-binding protein 2